jgi:hypothetical protein
MHSPVHRCPTRSRFFHGPLCRSDASPSPSLPRPSTAGAVLTLKPCRRVQFFEARIVGMITPHSCLTDEERSQIWYQQQELDEFKNEARSLCRDMRDQKTRIADNSQVDDVTGRGLEHRVCIKRQRNKALAVRCILKTQDRNKDPSFIAMISEKCTLWAKEVAVAEASRDYCRVYCPYLLPCLPSTENIQQHPIPFKKRQAPDTDMEHQKGCVSRNLRRRVA